MKTRLAKSLSSLVLAAAISFTGMTAHAAEVSDNAYIGSTNICDTENWSIKDYADNIKNVYIMSYPDGAEMITEVVDGYLSDNEFIAAFEKIGGSAFLIVEEALHNALEPNAAPIIYESDGYFSRHSIPTIKQKSGYNDGAAAAVLMALYGCGHYNFYKDASLKDSQQSALISEMAWNSNKKTTISEVTRTLRRYYSGTYGRTFQTKYASDFNEMIRILTNSLYMDAAPIIRIPDGNSYYYGVVSSICDNDELENITIIDPRTGTYLSYALDEFKAMLFKDSYSIVWMSVYDHDNSAQAIDKVKKEYPSDDSYFSKDGTQCAVHDDNCDFYGGCSCKSHDGSIQCMGFAKYVFNQVKGRLFSSYANEANVTGFGYRGSNYSLTGDGYYEGENLNEQTAKKYLQGLPTGAYVRLKDKDTTKKYPWHSFAVLETSDTEIKVYEANVGGKCLVKINTYKWADLAEKYNLLFYVD